MLRNARPEKMFDYIDMNDHIRVGQVSGKLEDLKRTNPQGQTPLVYAAINKKWKCLHAMLDGNAYLKNLYSNALKNTIEENNKIEKVFNFNATLIKDALKDIQKFEDIEELKESDKFKNSYEAKEIEQVKNLEKANNLDGLQLELTLLECILNDENLCSEKIREITCSEKISKLVAKNAIAICPDTGYKALHVAVARKNKFIVKQLLEDKADPSITNAFTETNMKLKITPLEIAVRDNNVPIAKLLVQYGAAQDVFSLNQQAPIVYAAKNKHWEMVKCLLEAKSDEQSNTPPAHGSIALGYAVANGQNAIASSLLNKNVDPNERYSKISGFYPIHETIQQKNLHLLTILLEHKANPSIKTKISKINPDEMTPLELAIKNDFPSAIPQLNSKNADLSVKDSKGLNLLEQALASERWECAKELLKLDYFSHNEELLGKILVSLCAKQQFEFAKIILEHGPKLGRHGPKGHTALHFTAMHNDIELTQLLLEQKADPHLKTSIPNSLGKCKSALDIAIDEKHNGIVALFDPDLLNPEKIAKDRFSDIHSFHQTYQQLSDILTKNSHFDTIQLSKNIPNPLIAPMFDLAEIALHLKQDYLKELDFPNKISKIFTLYPDTSHPYIARALLAIIKQTFEKFEVLDVPTKEHICHILKIHKSSDEIKHDSLHINNLRSSQAAACLKLSKYLYTHKLKDKLKVKISQIAASEYLQEMFHNHNEHSVDEVTLTSMFGESVFQKNWFKLSKLSKCILKFIEENRRFKKLMAPEGISTRAAHLTLPHDMQLSTHYMNQHLNHSIYPAGVNSGLTLPPATITPSTIQMQSNIAGATPSTALLMNLTPGATPPSSTLLMNSVPGATPSSALQLSANMAASSNSAQMIPEGLYSIQVEGNAANPGELYKPLGEGLYDDTLDNDEGLAPPEGISSDTQNKIAVKNGK